MCTDTYLEILCHAAIAHTTIKRKKKKDYVFSHKFEEFSKLVSAKQGKCAPVTDVKSVHHRHSDLMFIIQAFACFFPCEKEKHRAMCLNTQALEPDCLDLKTSTNTY